MQLDVSLVLLEEREQREGGEEGGEREPPDLGDGEVRGGRGVRTELIR